jgi:hypothetical protein
MHYYASIVCRHHEAAQFSQNNTGNDLARLYSAAPGSVPFDDFDAEEHKRNLELLLSQERVVALIYAKTFPISAKAAASRTNLSIGMPVKPVLHARLGQSLGNNGRVSPTEFGGAVEGSMFDSDDSAGNRPQTASAVMGGGNARSDKFPPIVGGNQPANRLASR